MRKYACFLAMGIILLGITGLEAASEKELVVRSSRQRIDYQNRIFIYTGQVKAIWADLVLEADEVEVYLTENNTVKQMLAKGGVKVTEQAQKREASCEHLTYTGEEDKFILEGNVHYWDGMGNELLAEKAIIWREENKLEAEGTPVEATYLLGEEEVGSESRESH